MENSSVLDNSNNGSSFKEKKPKRKLNKKVLIICSLITFLIILAAVYFIINNRYTKMVENYINEELSYIAQDYGNRFNYKPFKCSGFKEVKCSTDFIELYEEPYKFSVKNISFTAAPSVTDVRTVSSGNIEIRSAYTKDDLESNNAFIKLNLNFNCSDNMTLLSERSLLAHNVVCDSSINDIHSKQVSIVYMKNDIYAQNSSIFGVFKDIKGNNEDFMNFMLNNATVVESSLNVIESPDLFESIMQIAQILFKPYLAENITKEMAVSLYDRLRSDYNQVKGLYGNDEDGYAAVVDNLINAVDGIVYHNNNSVSVSIDLKDKDKIDDMLDYEYRNIITPDYYDINITSSK